MNRYLVGAAMVVGTIALIYVGSARADVPKTGEPFTTPNGILCDERSQIDDLIAGSRLENGKGIIPVYQRLNAIRDVHGEPTCLIQPIIRAAVKSVEDIGETQGFDGTRVHGYVVEISGSDGATGWLLYGEVVPGTDA